MSLGTPALPARYAPGVGRCCTIRRRRSSTGSVQPSAAVHRADLQALLLQELGEGPLRLGSEVEGFEQDEAGVTVLLAGDSEERADLLVGADGLHSRIREKLFGPGELRYAGYTAWRAVAKPAREILPWGTGFESWGRGVRFGCAHIGKGRVYWFATRNAAEGGRSARPAAPPEPGRPYSGSLESGTTPSVNSSRPLTRRRYAAMTSSTASLSARWGMGRVTLLGDAAHPMTPNLGQGACQAIEDAVVLARCLREVDGVARPCDATRSYAPQGRPGS